jgi:hypothetical protein
MKPNLPSETISALMTRGIGVIDFESGASAEAADATARSRAGASKAFPLYRKLTRRGGYGVLADEGNEKLVVGRMTPPCRMFLPLETPSGDEQTHKAFQFGRYAELTDSNEFEELYEAVRNRDRLPALVSIKSGENNKGPGREAVLETFHELESKGRLRRPR